MMNYRLSVIEKLQLKSNRLNQFQNTKKANKIKNTYNM